VVISLTDPYQIVAILVGAVWGLWIGFGIVAAGQSTHSNQVMSESLTLENRHIPGRGISGLYPTNTHS
jgi:hypothetical protein